MNIHFKSATKVINNNVRYMQEGGAMPAEGAPMPEEGAPEEGAPQGGGEDQLAQVAQQLVEMLMQQVGDPNACLQILQMAAEMLQQGGGAPEPQAAPVYGKGGRLIRRIAK